MSRFNNLEFGEEFDGELQNKSAQPVGSKPKLVKDEAHYLAEAKCALESGKFDHALRAFSKVLEFNPRNPAAWTGQVRMLVEMDDLEAAKLWADKALENFPHEPELLAAKAVVLARSGDHKAALAYSDAAIDERGDTPYIWLARGDVQLARAEKRADFCFEKALSLSPGDWVVRWLAARAHYYYEKFAAALKLVQEALTLNASQAVLWLQMGFCQQGLGLVSAARTSFQHARELSPDSEAPDDALRGLYQLSLWERLHSRWRQFFNG